METQTVSPLAEDVVLEELISSGILTEDENEITVTNSFVDSIDSIQSRLDKDKPTNCSQLEDFTENKELISAAMRLTDRTNTPMAIFIGLKKRLNIPETNCVQLVPVVDQLLRGPPESSGCPRPFFPIRGDVLHFLIPILQQGIIYFWRQECDPCDLVKKDFEEYFATSPTDMALLAIYGSEWIDDIREYDVGAAPTILFLRNGRIDSRLVGAFPQKAIVNEIEKISGVD